MRSSIRRAFVCLPLLVFALALGCSSPPPKAPKTVKTVTFIPNNYSNFWKVARKGCEKADAELADVNVNFKPVYGGTAVEQNRFIREALEGDTDAIAISPIDSAGQKATLNNAAKKAVLITQDSDAPDSDRVLYIGADNRAAGRQAGELVKKALPQGGKIMVFVGKREVQNAQERFEGLKEALQGSKVEILDLMTDDTDPSKARDNAYQAWKQHPDIAGMVGLWSYNGPAILSALRAENLVGKIKIVCFDDERETLEAIKAGSIFGTVAQQPYEYGYQAVQAAAKLLRGDKSVVPATKTMLIPTTVVERGNVDDYLSKQNKLLAGT
ncbi:MAG TPA: sugar-binding protein [Pyrinomonadaceae bacterium]|jgi:ribose transport system substrate-binding protein